MLYEDFLKLQEEAETPPFIIGTHSVDGVLHVYVFGQDKELAAARDGEADPVMGADKSVEAN